jgi:hypothetical protein
LILVRFDACSVDSCSVDYMFVNFFVPSRFIMMVDDDVLWLHWEASC